MMKKRLLGLAALALCVLMAMQTVGVVLSAVAAETAPVTPDEQASSITYTPSADGKSMTISYLQNGEPVSYTVPNSKNYLSGGLAGVDDLGREMYDTNDRRIDAVSADQERFVGLFYFLWMGEHVGNSANAKAGIALNMQNILNGTTDQTWGGYGEMHWFAEPLYGYYLSTDEWVMRKHAELLTNANVDFLYFDVTNQHAYIENAKRMMSALHDLNEQGYDAPQVVFYTNAGETVRIKEVYEGIYKANVYPDTWFRIDGKPVIVAPRVTADTVIMGTGNPGVKVMDVFTVKASQWPIPVEELNTPEDNFDLKNNSWPWMDFHWPQKIYTDAKGKNGAINVSVAQHSGNGNFSSVYFKNYLYNRGRSYQSNGTRTSTPHYSDVEIGYNLNVLRYYRNWVENPELSYQGLNFQEQFDYAISSSAKYILVTGWNEWIAGNQGTASEPSFVDCVSIEYSRDTEMMRGGYFDNYYMQLAYNIQRAKGTAPVIIQDGRKAINVKGSFDQWNDVLVTYFDAKGDTADRNATAFSPTGKITATNTSGRNDIVASKVISDSKNLYFYVETAENITARDTESSWMQVYVNADRDATTGWYGYDYIVNYKAEGDNTTTVAKYTGKKGAYKFTAMSEKISYSVKDNKMMISVPLSQLGIEDYLAIDVEFKVADSETIYNEMEDFYCEGDMAPLGRMNFVYCNYSVVEEEEIESETESETTVEVESETTLESEAAPETDAPAKKDSGCAGMICGSTALAVLTMIAGAAYVTRKRH